MKRKEKEDENWKRERNLGERKRKKGRKKEEKQLKCRGIKKKSLSQKIRARKRE